MMLRIATTVQTPDFLGIGAQKSGTTWLAKNLACHPDIFLPKKELHYFDWNYHSPYGRYLSHFSGARGGQSKGEITPSYCMLPVERLEFMRSAMPAVKILFIMRNPVDRAWSQAKMRLVKRVNQIGELANARNFYDAPDKGSVPHRTLDEIPEREFLRFFKEPCCIERGNYAQILDVWYSVFPADQIKLLFHDDIEIDPRGLLTEVFDHLGVPTDVNWRCMPYDRVINKGIGPEIPVEFRRFLYEVYEPHILDLADRYNQKAERWLAG